jgi:hypothetical protein
MISIPCFFLFGGFLVVIATPAGSVTGICFSPSTGRASPHAYERTEQEDITGRVDPDASISGRAGHQLGWWSGIRGRCKLDFSKNEHGALKRRYINGADDGYHQTTRLDRCCIVRKEKVALPEFGAIASSRLIAAIQLLGRSAGLEVAILEFCTRYSIGKKRGPEMRLAMHLLQCPRSLLKGTVRRNSGFQKSIEGFHEPRRRLIVDRPE